MTDPRCPHTGPHSPHRIDRGTWGVTHCPGTPPAPDDTIHLDTNPCTTDQPEMFIPAAPGMTPPILNPLEAALTAERDAANRERDHVRDELARTAGNLDDARATLAIRDAQLRQARAELTRALAEREALYTLAALYVPPNMRRGTLLDPAGALIPEAIDQSTWPAHLRDDAPMTQPDGRRCPGELREAGTARPPSATHTAEQPLPVPSANPHPHSGAQAVPAVDASVDTISGASQPAKTPETCWSCDSEYLDIAPTDPSWRARCPQCGAPRWQP